MIPPPSLKRHVTIQRAAKSSVTESSVIDSALQPGRRGSKECLHLERPRPRFANLYLNLEPEQLIGLGSPLNNSNTSTPTASRPTYTFKPPVGTPSMKMVAQVQRVLSGPQGKTALHRMDVESTGAVYKLKDLAVFKPEDEEVVATASLASGEPNPVRGGLLLGGGARRERAAYVLDRNYDGFSGVPPTQLACLDTEPMNQQRQPPCDPTLHSSKAETLLSEKKVSTPTGFCNRSKCCYSFKVETSEKREATFFSKEPKKRQDGEANGKVKGNRSRNKRGSLQKYCENEGSAEERFDLRQRATADAVQRIAVLDVRLFNTDRHGGNILLHQELDKSVRLIPIDHGLTLPHWQHLAEAYFDWAYWPQAVKPFTHDVLTHIEMIQEKKDAESLRELGLREPCVVTNMLATTALKVGVKSGKFKNIKDMAEYFQRPFPKGHHKHLECPSQFEEHIDRSLKDANLPVRDDLETRYVEKLLESFAFVLRSWKT